MPKRPISACPAVGEADFTSLSARANESDKLTYHLRSQPESVAEARALTRAALLRWGHPELIEDATLIVSELVTNAIRYAHAPGRGRTGDPLTLVLLRVASHVLLAVGDPSPRIPARAELDDASEHGRGLHIVDTLSKAWGWELRPGGGKAVWALLSAEA